VKEPRQITFEFVDTVPPTREEGKLYISIKYRTAIHSCFCGCGMKVVTPIRPTGWQLTYNGEAVTLYPSIGNWSFKCRSHYWIRDNQATPAGPMSRHEIDAGRSRDAASREDHLATKAAPLPASEAAAPTPRVGFWRRLFRRN
jgi:Family of unknown function (DUF6527)